MAFLKLLISRNVISGMGKRFNGIWSKDLCQTMEKAITEKMEKIVQLRDKQQIDEFKSEMNELRAFLTAHQQIEKEFNEKLKKMIEDQQLQQKTIMSSVLFPDNLKDKKLSNVDVNYWNSKRSNMNLEFSSNGIKVETATVWEKIIAAKGFPILSYEHGGRNMHYYEIISSHSSRFRPSSAHSSCWPAEWQQISQCRLLKEASPIAISDASDGQFFVRLLSVVLFLLDMQIVMHNVPTSDVKWLWQRLGRGEEFLNK